MNNTLKCFWASSNKYLTFKNDVNLKTRPTSLLKRGIFKYNINFHMIRKFFSHHDNVFPGPFRWALILNIKNIQDNGRI